MGLPVRTCSSPSSAMISVPEACLSPRMPGSRPARSAPGQLGREGRLCARKYPSRTSPGRRPAPSVRWACPCPGHLRRAAIGAAGATGVQAGRRPGAGDRNLGQAQARRFGRSAARPERRRRPPAAAQASAMAQRVGAVSPNRSASGAPPTPNGSIIRICAAHRLPPPLARRCQAARISSAAGLRRKPRRQRRPRHGAQVGVAQSEMVPRHRIQRRRWYGNRAGRRNSG